MRPEESNVQTGFDGLMEEIERLEIRIEELREAIGRSRRLMLAGRAAAVVGPALLVCIMLGALDFTPVRMIVAFALAIGGIVLSGSSRASTEQLERSLRADRERKERGDRRRSSSSSSGTSFCRPISRRQSQAIGKTLPLLSRM